MKERTAWPSILALALLLGWVEPAPCAAQPPAPATATAGPRRPRDVRELQPAAPPATAPVASRGRQPSPTLAAVGGVLRDRALREAERPGPAAADRRPRTGRPSAGRRTGARRGARRRSVPRRPPPPARRPPPARPRPLPTAPSPLATRPRLNAAPFEPDRPPVPDQPGHRAAALRRPAADRRRGAGPGLGRRGRADAGQGPLGPRPQRRLRLPPPRRRRPRLQQGHHDRAEHELLLRRRRPAGDCSPRPTPSSSPWWPGRS